MVQVSELLLLLLECKLCFTELTSFFSLTLSFCVGLATSSWWWSVGFLLTDGPGPRTKAGGLVLKLCFAWLPVERVG